MWTFNLLRYINNDSSNKDIDHQNPKKTTTIQPETITGSLMFKILGCSLSEGIGIGKKLHSDDFTVGGYKWRICYYPDGRTVKDRKFVSFLLELKGDARDVKAKVTFTVLHQNGISTSMSRTSQIITFKSTSGNYFSTWGYDKLCKRKKLVASKYQKDDTLTMNCTVVVFQEAKLQKKNISGGIIIPHKNLNWNMCCLLNNGDGADVTFVVKGKSFKAHRWMLAARSPIFKAQFFGGMMETSTDIKTIEDMEAEVFESMLYFIYSDSLPDFRRISEYGKKDQDVRFKAQQMLVAADMFGLERMRLICEDLLAKNLDEMTVATTLLLAEQHNCSQLKSACLKYMSSLKILKVVARTKGFQQLMDVCPSIWKDIVFYLKN